MAEPNTIGLTADAHSHLKELQASGTFAEMADAYRLAVALALAANIKPNSLPIGKTSTIFNVGTLDPDRLLYTAVAALGGDDSMAIYEQIEKLAEWGVEMLHKELVVDRQSLASVLATTA